MKTVQNKLALCIIIALFPLAGFAQFNNGLVAYYQFEGTGNDSSGNNLNGTLTNAGFATGRFGLGLSTSGSLNSYCQVQPDALLSPTNAVSVSLWFMERSYPTQPSSCLFYKATKTPTSNGFTDRAYSLWIFNDGHFELASTAVGAPSQSYCSSSSGLVQLNQFYHVVGVVDSTAQTMTIYLNSQLVGSTSYSPAGISSGNWPLLIGAPFQTLSDEGALNGVIDEFRIYNRAVSANEVQQLYAYRPPSDCPRRAVATAQLDHGFVVGAAMTDGGCGYTDTPLVLIQGGGGTGATATAVVSNGIVVNIAITDAGIGYTSTPAIYIYSPFGLQIGLVKAVMPSFSDLLIGTNYQLQISGDLLNWTNQGAPFTATNAAMLYPQYWDVDNWNSLFFRLTVSP